MNLGASAPSIRESICARTLGEIGVLGNQPVEQRHIVVRERIEIHAHRVAALLGEIAALVEHVGDAAVMPAAKLRPHLPSTTTTPRVMYSQHGRRGPPPRP